MWRIAARDGVRLAVRDYGDPRAPGAPLLCLGGLTRNSRDFVHVARRHAPVRRVVAPDYRGRGASERAADARAYAPEVLLDDILQVMAALHLRAPVVLGTSLGGSLAMAVAVVAPTRLSGVILNDTGPELKLAGVRRILDALGRDRPQADWDEATRAVRALFPGLGVRDAATWRRIAEATFAAGRDGRLHLDWDPRVVTPFRHLRRRDMWPLFRALRRRPVLALRGGHSDVLAPAALRRMRIEKPDLITVTIPGRGHAPLLDEADAEHAIDEFLHQFDP